MLIARLTGASNRRNFKSFYPRDPRLRMFQTGLCSLLCSSQLSTVEPVLPNASSDIQVFLVSRPRGWKILLESRVSRFLCRSVLVGCTFSHLFKPIGRYTSHESIGSARSGRELHAMHTEVCGQKFEVWRGLIHDTNVERSGSSAEFTFRDRCCTTKCVNCRLHHFRAGFFHIFFLFTC